MKRLLTVLYVLALAGIGWAYDIGLPPGYVPYSGEAETSKVSGTSSTSLDSVWDSVAVTGGGYIKVLKSDSIRVTDLFSNPPGGHINVRDTVYFKVYSKIDSIFIFSAGFKLPGGGTDTVKVTAKADTGLFSGWVQAVKGFLGVSVKVDTSYSNYRAPKSGTTIKSTAAIDSTTQIVSRLARLDSLCSSLDSLRIVTKATIDSMWVFRKWVYVQDSIKTAAILSISSNLQIGRACSTMATDFLTLTVPDTQSAIGTPTGRVRNLNIGHDGSGLSGLKFQGPSDSTMVNIMAGDSLGFKYAKYYKFTATPNKALLDTSSAAASILRPSANTTIYGKLFLSSTDSTVYFGGKKNDRSADSLHVVKDLTP